MKIYKTVLFTMVMTGFLSFSCFAGDGNVVRLGKINVGDFILDGNIGSTDHRVTKGWFTDLTITNAISGSVDGNAGTVTVAGTTTNNTFYPGVFSAVSGSLAPYTISGWYINPSTGEITFPGVVNATSFASAAVDDPMWAFTPLTEGASKWWVGVNHGGTGSATGPMEFRQSGTAGTDVRVSISTTGALTAAGTINGLTRYVVITTAEGADDTSSSAAFLTDSGESWPTNGYVGMTLYNVTDSSSCTVTANTDTTMTCTLAGGTANAWNSGDAWAVAPGPGQSGSIFYIGAATTILHPSTPGYVAMYYSIGANVVTVDPQSDSMQFVLNGTATGTDGEELDSPGAAGDFIAIHNVSATSAYTLGRSGTWIDGGAS